MISIEDVADTEVVEKELWDITSFTQRVKFRQHLRDRGFELARECWYHPAHWRVEDYDFGPEKGRYCVISEAYVPLTAAAKTWRKKVIAEWKEKGSK